MQVDAKAVARELLTDKQFRCFTRLIGKESAWNSKAKNPSSSAIGIGQLLESTYQNLGMKHSKAEVPQMVAALAYIGRKYGSAGPCGAWRHWQKKNWY
jgi:SLT domain-containing protein